MLITAYVPCYNGAAYLDAVLRALNDQSRRPDEIIVVDDGSTDRSAELAGGHGVRVITHGCNRGIAAARNTALQAARGELLIGLDADAVPAEDYVERIESAFEGHPQVAAVCGRLIESHSVLLPDRWRQIHMAQHYGTDRLPDPRICFGSVTTVRKRTAEELGGWNEQYRTNYEDVDFTRRMYDAGRHCLYDPSCKARHQRRDSVKSVLSGFWQWFAPQGRDQGHFTSLETLTRHRLEPVNWGIFKHRFRDDREQGRAHLLGLTFLLPWWMTLRDLAEVPGGGSTGRALVKRLPDVVGQLGAGDYVIQRTTEELSSLCERLFPRDGGPAGAAEQRLLSSIEACALRFLPGDRLAWSQIEFSLRRLDRERELNESCEGDYRVLLANPPWYTADRQGVRAGSRWPFTLDRRDRKPIPRYVPFPFFLAQAAELLCRRGVPNAIVDAIAEGLSYEEFHERVVGYEPSLVVLETSAASFENDRRIWGELKAALPQARLVLAGPHATARWREILEDARQIDMVLIGEYEATLGELAAVLARGGDPAAVRGLALHQDGRLLDTGRPEPVNFDEVGIPDRLRLPLYNYRDAFAGLPEPAVQLMATRGCPFECTFCQWPQVFYEGRRIQRRSVESVFEEVRELVTRFGFETVYFDDDMFSPGGKWISRFTELVREHRLDFAWSVMSRADTFGPEQWRAMAAAGLRAVKFGVESGDQGMLDSMGKRLNLDQVRRTVRVCREAGISVHLTFTVGLPGESRDTLAKTRKLILELLPNSLQISRAMPLPGTALEDWALVYGGANTREPSALDGFLRSVLEHPGLGRGEIDRFIEETYAEYRATLKDGPCPSSNMTPCRPESELVV
jgi:radical SAM superfamily enzyme YgiQ (UPF0313 family)/glycosyltransferase involved in cell wall biosynthesis